MNWILKQKEKEAKTLLVVLFLAFLFIFNSSKANALTVGETCGENTAVNEAKSCVCKDASENQIGSTTGTCSKEDCGRQCIGQGGKFYSWDNKSLTPINGVTDAAGNAKTLTEGAEMVFVTAIKKMLVGVFNLCGWLFGIAATLFAWVIDPKNVSGPQGLLQKQAVKDVWIMVRDLLNLSFILVLLFAAFGTIFQLDKWNIKKVWLSILINALMVNFSFPIARFIIDISNIAFYYFTNHLFNITGTVNGGSIFAALGNASRIGNVFLPKDYSNYDIAYLIAITIFTFIMGMTILMIAALFVVRLVALTMLVMFSPIGFVGYIFPATSKYADKWWDNLFSYSFFAPIMIFGIAISLRILEALGQENLNSFLNHASGNVSGDVNWIANAAFFMIPIIVLWGVMGVAKSSGVALSNEIVSTGKKWERQLPMVHTGPHSRTQLLEVSKKVPKKNPNTMLLISGGKSPSKVEAAVKGGVIGMGTSKGVIEGGTGALAKLQYNEIRDAVEEHKKNKTSHSALVLDLDKKGVKGIAAAMALAETDDIRNATEFDKGLKALAGNKDLTTKFIQKGQSAIKDVKTMQSAFNALGNDTKSIGTLIDKINPGALTMNETEYVGLIAGQDVGIQKQLEGKMKKEGHTQTLVKYMVMNTQKTLQDYQTAYDNLVADMSPADLAKQKDSLHNDPNFIHYVMNNSGNSQSFSDEHRKNVFAELSGKKKAIWVNSGIHP